jgi:NAD(P)-dependent dehydrogenase (short-subunit alcohol dehydrogenase family)
MDRFEAITKKGLYMTDLSTKVALVTGANSGLGFEASAQLAEAGYGKIILACRSEEKAEGAREHLIERCGRDVFDTLVIDTAEPESGVEAAQELLCREEQIDALVLNAGMGAKQLQTNSDGVDVVYASTLAGHHVLTQRLLEANMLAPGARIVIAGSEAARSDLPGMGMEVSDFKAIADERYDGNLTEALVETARGKVVGEYNPNHAYANAKSMVAWWAAALARRLPEGMAVYAVSPGAAMGTSFSRNMPFFMRAIMVPMMRIFGPVFGMTGSVSQGARRYIDATGFDIESNGSFYASPPKKMVGTLQIQDTPHLVDEELQEAGWSAIMELTKSADEGRHAQIDEAACN